MSEILDMEDDIPISNANKYKWPRRIYTVLYLVPILFLIALTIYWLPATKNLDQYTSTGKLVQFLNLGTKVVGLAFIMSLLGLIKHIRLNKYVLILGVLVIFIIMYFVVLPINEYVVEQYMEMGREQGYME